MWCVVLYSMSSMNMDEKDLNDLLDVNENVCM